MKNAGIWQPGIRTVYHDEKKQTTVFKTKKHFPVIQEMHFFLSPKRCAEKKYPDELPTVSVVLIYLDEALSIIKRAIRSIIDRTPSRLLAEIILVDDHSKNGRSTCSTDCPRSHILRQWEIL